VLNLAATMLARGYSDDDVHKILDGNLVRVFDEVRKEPPA
jgi:microsomal dipeptidase-like Zn-dependent dipeptidase